MNVLLKPININNAKGKKDRVVTLSQSILPILREYYAAYKPKTWFFERQHFNEHYSSQSAQQIFKDAYKKLQLPAQCSFHSLRHSFATHLLENGTDIRFIVGNFQSEFQEGLKQLATWVKEGKLKFSETI